MAIRTLQEGFSDGLEPLVLSSARGEKEIKSVPAKQVFSAAMVSDLL